MLPNLTDNLHYASLWERPYVLMLPAQFSIFLLLRLGWVGPLNSFDKQFLQALNFNNCTYL